MEDIIEKIDRSLLKKELNSNRFVRKTNNGNNEIYIINFHNSPNVMREIARLREVTFRAAGGGTGKSLDIDEFDTQENPYEQLLVWNPNDEEIVGAYRFILCKNAISEDGKIHLATTEIFKFSDKFIKEYLPFSIELGRSFVQPEYQPSEKFRKGLFSLDNLWDGLGALILDNPTMKYFFGKVTMYSHFNSEARDKILAFMRHYFPDKEDLVTAVFPLDYTSDVTTFLANLSALDYKEGHALLNKEVRALGENIPPLVNSYMNLSQTMKTFGTSQNPFFGDVEETGIMVTIDDIYPSKKERHLDSYSKEKSQRNLN